MADPQFGLKFGAQYEPRHAGVVGNIALASRTVGEAFETIGRYLPTMVDATVHGVEVSDGVVFVYSYYIDPLMMSYREKADWRSVPQPRAHGPRRSALKATEGFVHQLADETPARRRVRAEVMGDSIRIGHPLGRHQICRRRPAQTADGDGQMP